jgi:major vault protein
MTDAQQKRDLVLPPGGYAYMQDVTKGVVKTYTGPTVINPTAQERPVVYDAVTGTFRSATSLEDAMKIAPVAAEGFYVILRNPARANKHPEEASAQPAAELEIGRTIIVPGPATFALWPGQSAAVVEGHHLRSNQYLLVRIYNEDEARKNWSQAVVKPAVAEGEAPVAQPSKAPPPDLTVGKQLIIRGTEVSFYIPPTGVEVVADGDGKYAREALTLERLEYAILVDENGKKRYEVGPQVVFPLPTERFVEARDDGGRPSKKFRAVELNEIQGLHIKVIADYSEGGRTHKAGDELFITGKDTAIYFPREEHSAIKYDGKAKHFATAIPAGEARYVMDRLTGAIRTVRGPAMLLPDPRTEVIVRRVLTDRECQLWYPGNSEALEYNQGIRSLLGNVPTTRHGVLSEGDVERGGRGRRGGHGQGGQHAVAGAGQAVSAMAMESSRVSGDQALVADEFSRASTYTQPRTITLDSKFQGAPQIAPWTGFAVCVTSKTGKRRVERGPTTVLLDYDETLEVLALSVGTPKWDAKTVETPYLRVENNRVSDVIQAETQDHVPVEIRVAYRVDFEGDAMRWFAVADYVKLLCDHVRSLVKGQVWRHKIEELHATATDKVRDFVLGAAVDGKRPGLLFGENGMRVVDVEVLGVVIRDEAIRTLLDQAQREVVKSAIDLSNQARGLEATRQRERMSRDELEIKAQTKKRQDELVRELAASELATALARIGNAMKEQADKQKLVEAEQAVEEIKFGTRLERVKREREQELVIFAREQEKQIEMLRAQAEAAVQRFGAVSGNFSEALLALSRNDTLVKVAQAWDVQRIVAGESLGDTLQRLFHDTPLKGLVEQLVPKNGERPKAVTTVTPPGPIS